MRTEKALKAARRKLSQRDRRADTRLKIIVGSHQLSLHGRRLHDLPLGDLARFREWLESRPREVEFLEKNGVDFSPLEGLSNGDSAVAESASANGRQDRDTAALAQLGSWVIDRAIRKQPDGNLRKLTNAAIAEDTDNARQATLTALVKRRQKAYKAALTAAVVERAKADEAIAESAADAPNVDLGEDEDL